MFLFFLFSGGHMRWSLQMIVPGHPVIGHPIERPNGCQIRRPIRRPLGCPIEHPVGCPNGSPGIIITKDYHLAIPILFLPLNLDGPALQAIIFFRKFFFPIFLSNFKI